MVIWVTSKSLMPLEGCTWSNLIYNILFNQFYLFVSDRTAFEMYITMQMWLSRCGAGKKHVVLLMIQKHLKFWGGEHLALRDRIIEDHRHDLWFRPIAGLRHLFVALHVLIITFSSLYTTFKGNTHAKSFLHLSLTVYTACGPFITMSCILAAICLSFHFSLTPVLHTKCQRFLTLKKNKKKVAVKH